MSNFSLEEINRYAESSPERFIASCEERYLGSLEKITEDICLKKGRTLIMLAGPSSSGKTTTAKILRQDIMKRGRHATVISLDDYYLEQEKSYYFEDGTVDYETVKALDLDLITGSLRQLIETGSAEVPQFSFITKRRDGFRNLEVSADEIIIVEGLHAINPLITEPLSGESLKKIYVSVSSRMYDDGNLLLNKRDMRFIRRMVRDYHFRNSSVEYTFYLWNGVRMGEDRYLFPYSADADIRIDSTHAYEPCLFKNIAMELLDHLPHDSVYYPTARALSEKLSAFSSISQQAVPENSLLREFIG